jgi:hypothetical protein
MVGAEGTASYFYHPIGIVLAIVNVAVPSSVALILLTAILRGSDETCNRVFRLLRWIRPETATPSDDNCPLAAENS